MTEIIKRRLTLAAVVAAALALSACSAPAGAPAAAATGAAPSSEASAVVSPASAPGPDPVAYDGQMMAGINITDAGQEQMLIAQDYIGKMTTNGYTLSGQWTLDGNDNANTAKLWSNYFSDSLKAKLTAAGNSGDIKDFGMWSAFAVAPTDSTDPIKASPSCKASHTMCAYMAPMTDSSQPGAMQMVGGIPSGSFPDTRTPNRVTFDYDVVVPVSLSQHGNAEGVLRGALKVDLTFVDNPTPGDGRPKYLIDAVHNDLRDAKADLLSNSPELKFSAM